jgi:hypothetical protein
MSLADLDAHEWAAFRSAADEVGKRIEQTYGSVVEFEHGSAAPNRPAGCGVDHAHLHIVPAELNLRDAIEAISSQVGHYEWSSVAVKPERIESLDYLYVSDQTGRWISYAPLIQSQVVRRALAAAAGREIWDWKQDYCLDVAANTLAALGDQIA